MKRRSILKTFAAMPAAAAAVPAAPAQAAPASTEPFPKLALHAPDSAADPVRRFFTPGQFAALTRLGDMLVPAFNGRPSASQTEAPAFLDFVVRESPAGIQKLYRDGLDQLNSAAQSGHGAPFDKISADQAAKILAPLQAAWTYDGPPDTFAKFLQQAKSDFLQAAMNSREWAESASRGRRGAGGMTNYFWRAVE